MPRLLLENLNMECALRLVVACICGAIIGVERSRRNKGAGIRIHVIVAMGAALFVIVSKYGFADLVYLENMQVDISRIASNIVAGVSFLGAGVIFLQGDRIQGLTTAAGIWVTAAVGMAIGSGMYITGFFCAALLLFLQEVLHSNPFTKMDNAQSSQIVVSMDDDPEEYESFRQVLMDQGIILTGSHIKRHKDGMLTYTLDVKLPKDIQPKDVLAIAKKCGDVKSIGM